MVVSDVWLPRLREFKPEMIFISAGFDAHYEDDMASLGLVESDYAWVTQQLKQTGQRVQQGAHCFPAGRRLRAFGAGA
jgi:acetoin utilization deacetylase AcuC-like enzyme